MKKYCKFSFIMVIIVIVSNILPNIKVLAQEQIRLNFVVPEDVEPPTSYEEVTNRLLAWKDILPDGTVWNEYTPYTMDNSYEWNAYSPTIYSIACEAFADFLSDVVFGDLPARRYDKDEITFEQIRPGDILKFSSPRHAVIVIRVNKDDETITVTEANVNGGVVRWGKVRSKEYVMSRIGCLYTRYPEGFVDGQPTVSTSVAPSASVAPSPTPSVSTVPSPTPSVSTVPSPTPLVSVAPSSTPYKYANEQRVKKSYTYLYDSKDDAVDFFILKKGKLTYKNEQLPFKSIRWADFNESAHIIVVQKNGVYFSVSYTNNGIEIKKLGKDAKKRKKKNGLVTNIVTKNGKKDVTKK